ncbi:MAG: hypothetical protein A2X64_00470 [Ignavibacteria bacterium GWF2_33_9]|nr:MAG: hypothetical protein A2X64_00470 [Ignavibacteria bacterium GWF2_33_9]
MKINPKFVFLILTYFIINGINLNAELDSVRQKEINFAVKKFQYMLEIADKFHKDSLRIPEVSSAAFKAFLNSLDNQSIYYNKDEFTKINDANTGNSEGIGIEIVPLADTLTIIKVIQHSPADSAGLQQGDKILFINGQSAIAMAKSSADSMIAGEPGTKVQLIIKRQFGTSLLNEYIVERNEFNLPSLDAAFIIENTKIGYMKLSRFSSKTDEEINENLAKLSKKGMNTLIVDLRGNLGGVLNATLSALSNFFPKDTKLLKINAKYKDFDTVRNSEFEGKYQKLKLAVLVDKNSASASEIFAGVLQDYDRGLIIGENTYQKGTVQRIWNMVDGTGFRITIAEYETPSGRRIQKPEDSLKHYETDPAFEMNASAEEKKRIKEMIKLTGGHTYFPIVTTQNGRYIIVRGGVVPDIQAVNDSINILTKVLTKRGYFLEFVYNFLYSQKDELLKKYKEDFYKFNNEYKIDDNFLNDFKSFSLSKNVWNEEYYTQDKEYFRIYLKALIAYNLWGENGYRCVMMRWDKIVQTALNSLNRYESILQIH